MRGISPISDVKVRFLLLLAMASVILAGPARRDCGATKSFTATNQCGVVYGGTWIECANGLTEMPTFTIPECSATPLAAVEPHTAIEPEVSNMAPTPKDADAPPVITPAPTLISTPMDSEGNATTSSCSSLWLCIDALAVCGGTTQMYGACYDTCTKTTLSSPPCTLPPATAVPIYPAYNRTVPVLNFAKAPPREQKSWCVAKPWMCAPKGW